MKIENPRSRAYKIVSMIILVILAILFLFPLYRIITGAFKPAADIYARIDTILSALPENASAFVRDTARNLAVALFREDLERRLGKAGGGDETD